MRTRFILKEVMGKVSVGMLYILTLGVALILCLALYRAFLLQDWPIFTAIVFVFMTFLTAFLYEVL